jgi:hypothetical protein
METLFENRYYTRYPMMVEFFRKYGTGPRIPVVIASAVALIGIIAFCAVHGILDQMRNILIFVTVLDIGMFFLPHFVAWSSMRNGKKQNDGVIPETVITFGESIELHEGMVHITVEYSKIIRVVRLKHSYMLMIGKRNGVILDPDGFTKGTFEEFKQFIRGKRPDLVVPE